MSFENEVFDATVGSYVERTMESLGSSLADTMEKVVPAMDASEVAIEVVVRVGSATGKAEFTRRHSTIVWRSEEELAALEAELESEEAS